ncbi:hypothetical protein [Brevundimonas subvibrioides]|uniref:Uncharacterized protein n=1 Tax=Brevundimonas subvibrioides (strain ATCC 15264 / DSM 4735 / LMG 14903 / NBRC 16000 / CB 81) TaxID=633149 RepID=D9QID4_BRESC|nr:hypothetical protein [Brevundimonas subvibrioides]ADK99436.1 hypothetical protein Bresu_0122 [Brevundimonas subvibrioides ATCC 15264]
MTHATHTPRPTAETWALIRDDYRSGITAPVLAERYGVPERTLRRRAALEGWRRADAPTPSLATPPAWLRPPVSREEALARDPDLAEVDAAEGGDRIGLLFDPDPRHLRLFAFRQASEAAAMDRPVQAVSWMRLAQIVDRCGDRIEADGRPLREVDHLRAAYLRRLGELLPEDMPADDA